MIAKNIEILLEKLDSACSNSGRKKDDVKLIAVSKNFEIEDIQQAVDAGLKEFGENRTKELVPKFEHFSNSVTWHMIGTLQKNKVKYAVRCADFIHSVDTISLADEINKTALKNNKIQKVLVEVKTSFEKSKAGAEEEEVFKIVDFCKNASNLDVKGLMTIAPFVDDEKIIRKSFSDLRLLKEKLNSSGYNLAELSMGMSSDFEIAIDEGATYIRVGTAIFGTRIY